MATTKGFQRTAEAKGSEYAKTFRKHMLKKYDYQWVR